jgi:hypothetical protein
MILLRKITPSHSAILCGTPLYFICIVLHFENTPPVFLNLLFTFRARKRGYYFRLSRICEPHFVGIPRVALNLAQTFVAGYSRYFVRRGSSFREPPCRRFPQSVRRAMRQSCLVANFPEPIAEARQGEGLAESCDQKRHVAVAGSMSIMPQSSPRSCVDPLPAFVAHRKSGRSAVNRNCDFECSSV